MNLNTPNDLAKLEEFAFDILNHLADEYHLEENSVNKITQQILKSDNATLKGIVNSLKNELLNKMNPYTKSI